MIEDLKKHKICCECVGDTFLSAEMESHGKRGKCSYCGRVGRCYSLEQMSVRIEEAFEAHFVRTSDQPSAYDHTMMSDRESRYSWRREGAPAEIAIMDAAEISSEAAADIQTILADKYYDHEAAKCSEETEFDCESHYAQKPVETDRWWGTWREVERSLQTESRFFSRYAFDVLSSIFQGIETMQDSAGRPVIIEAGPGTGFTSVFRARVFESDDDLEEALARPDVHLGPPPSSPARGGRMNADGISVFYGSTEPAAALAEVRPPVGSRVAVAPFEIVRRVRLLDLEALTYITCHGSIFDEDYRHSLSRAVFLRRIGDLIAQPVLPARERFEYLMTQVIADFLATEVTPPLDGIIFPSIQARSEAVNLVLFHKASGVEELDFPKATEMRVSFGYQTEDEWVDDYSVLEETIPEKELGARRNNPDAFSTSFRFYDPPSEDRRSCRFDPTLRIDENNIEIHHIKSVEFRTEDFRVSRHRIDASRREDF
jgi:hypothetical protein